MSPEVWIVAACAIYIICTLTVNSLYVWSYYERAKEQSRDS